MSKSHKDSINEIKSDLDSSSNKQFLNRKKKRDTNISSEIFDFQYSIGEIRCSICLGEEKLVPNCYKCKTCSAYFHLECYNLFTLEETKEEKISLENMVDFECFRCREEKNSSKKVCFVCNTHTGIIKKYKEDKYLHHYCYVFFKDGLDVLKGGICKVCSHKRIPVLKCQEIKCKEKYHIQCAIDKQIIFWLPFMRGGEEKINEAKFNDKIPFLCEEHNKALIDNFIEYSKTMLLSKNDINPPEKNNEQINIQKDNNNNEKQLSPQKTPEIENKNIINNNNEVKSEIKPIKEEKSNENEKIINTVININVTQEKKSDNNILNINSAFSNMNIKEEKEIKEKNKSNDNDLIMFSNKNSENINLSPKKIDLSKNPSKVLTNSFVSNDIDVDIKINVEENEDDDDEEYDPPEINYDEVDLFENFKLRNEKFMIPGSFYKLHS